MLIVSLLIYASSSAAMAQKPGYKDSIEVVKVALGGLKFYQHDKRLTMGELTNIMRPNPEAFKYLKKAKTNNTIAFISGIVGGFLIGYELGRLVGDNEINWSLMGAGAGAIVIGIPFDISGRRNARKAVYLYNAAFR